MLQQASRDGREEDSIPAEYLGVLLQTLMVDPLEAHPAHPGTKSCHVVESYEVFLIPAPLLDGAQMPSRQSGVMGPWTDRVG